MSSAQRNTQAALLAAFAGSALLLSGWTGARPVDRLFTLLEEIFGGRPLLNVLAYVLVGLASLGGITVFLGGFLIWKDRVRLGRIFVLLGSGAGFFTLVLFVLVNLRREEYSLLFSVLPTILGIGIGIVARFWAKAKPVF